LGEKHEDELLYLNAAPAPIRWKQGMYRYQVLAKLLRTRHTADALRAVYAYADAHRDAEFVSLEINPSDMF
jgi:primosomal protein N'